MKTQWQLYMYIIIYIIYTYYYINIYLDIVFLDVHLARCSQVLFLFSFTLCPTECFAFLVQRATCLSILPFQPRRGNTSADEVTKSKTCFTVKTEVVPPVSQLHRILRTNVT